MNKWLLLGFLIACGGEGAADDTTDPIDTPDSGMLGPVQITDVSARVLGTYQCDPSHTGSFIACANYRITFSLRNKANRPTARVDNVQIDLDGVEFDTGANLTCDVAPWMASADGTSGVIDLDVSWGFADVPTLDYACPDLESPERVFFDQEVPPAPTEGAVRLKVTGILDDASLWSAEKAGAIL
jgi:hypothetical protein